MSLIDVKNYLRQQQQATLTDLANHFRAEPDAMRAMLSHWQRKGRVVQLATGGCGKGCAGCCQPAVEIYRWQDTEVPLPMPTKTCPH